jgi:hypothetical protein|tara:strand:+ start:2652 stop:3071 length:420 start_codon:yes stop_codon:yes gene_type:complete
MIKYALICECDKEFEGWFPDSKSFDKQKKAGLITCPMCDSPNVAKAVMAPSLKRKSNQTIKPAQSQLMMSGKARRILKTIEETVKKEFTNVGKQFPQEARKAAKGKRDEKIYGTATKKEIKQLESEGIDIFPVPEIKDN